MLARKRRRLPLTKPKTARELRAVKKAIGIVDLVFKEMESPFGRTEMDVAGEIRKIIRGLGARPSFRPIVATGRNTVFIHHRPGKRTISRENPLLIDLGARFQGQCSDITRMYIPPGQGRIMKIYRDVLYMQKRAIRKMKPGLDFRKLNEFYRKMMEGRGYRIRHSIGHGLGPRIHEGVGELKPGMVLTVEPGVYVKNLGGCRIEDMVLVRGKGMEILSGSVPERPFGRA